MAGINLVDRSSRRLYLDVSSPQASQNAPAMVNPESVTCMITKIGRTFFAAAEVGTPCTAADVVFEFFRTSADG